MTKHIEKCVYCGLVLNDGFKLDGVIPSVCPECEEGEEEKLRREIQAWERGEGWENIGRGEI